MAVYPDKPENEKELGFGKKSYSRGVRFINKDGSVNVKRTGLGRANQTDAYHWLISIPLKKFIMIIACGYTVVNLLFAGTYYMIGAQNFGGLDHGDGMSEFWGLFFFSAQTLTTLGYGHVYPLSIPASTVSAVESLIGLLSFALATGLLYGRFSRPKADLVYSKKILIAPYEGVTGLMFRIANKMQYELIECEASVTISYIDPITKKRDFDQLKLEIDKINFLSLSWTIVHPINDSSPVKGWTAADFRECDAEILILIKAINDTFSQTVYSRYSYKADDIVEKVKFKPLKQDVDGKGKVVIVVSEIHQYDAVSY
jgi:inward rectifier potassium channel